MNPAKLQQLMKQAQKMQNDLENETKKVESSIFEVNSQKDIVKLKLKGNYEIEEIKIKKEFVDTNDIEFLEDLIISVFREGRKKIEEEKDKIYSKYKNVGMPF